MLDDAICIRHWDWSETSQTVTLFCRSLGVVRGLAKGSKRPKSPFSGGIELLTRGRVGVILKPTSDLATLTEWDLSHTYPALRESLRANMAGQYLADLVNQFVRDHDPHPGLFDAMHMGLSMLRAGEPVWRSVVGFQWATLVETGFKPELHHDVRTGEVLSESLSEGTTADRESTGPPITLGFDPHAGGVVPDPGPPSSHHEAASVWRVRAATIEFLRQIEQRESAASAPPGDPPARHPEPLDEQTIERAARLLGAYLRHVLGHQPPTHEGLFGHDQPTAPA